jgi:hypothetical protein
MNLTKLAAALTVAALLPATVAFGATETVSTSCPVDTYSTAGFSLPAFDAALGTLTGAELELDSLSTVTFAISNLTIGEAPYTAASTVALIVADACGNVANAVGSSSASGTIPGRYHEQTVTLPVPADGDASVADLSLYEGAPISFSAVSSVTYLVSPIYDLAWTGAATGTADFSIVYTYTPAADPAPEPSTWAMMALGFAGLGLAGYRASKKRAALAA